MPSWCWCHSRRPRTCRRRSHRSARRSICASRTSRPGHCTRSGRHTADRSRAESVFRGVKRALGLPTRQRRCPPRSSLAAPGRRHGPPRARSGPGARSRRGPSANHGAMQEPERAQLLAVVGVQSLSDQLGANDLHRAPILSGRCAAGQSVRMPPPRGVHTTRRSPAATGRRERTRASANTPLDPHAYPLVARLPPSGAFRRPPDSEQTSWSWPLIIRSLTCCGP
jgi:hypothetical protein